MADNEIKKYAFNELGTFFENLKRRFPVGLRRFMITQEQRGKMAIAILALRTAISQTQKYLDGTVQLTEPEIKELWERAFESATAADFGPDFPQYLLYKINYWEDRAVWDNREDVEVLIPSLDFLKEKLDELSLLL